MKDYDFTRFSKDYKFIHKLASEGIKVVFITVTEKMKNKFMNSSLERSTNIIDRRLKLLEYSYGSQWITITRRNGLTNFIEIEKHSYYDWFEIIKKLKDLQIHIVVFRTLVSGSYKINPCCRVGYDFSCHCIENKDITPQDEVYSNFGSLWKLYLGENEIEKDNNLWYKIKTNIFSFSFWFGDWIIPTFMYWFKNV